MAAFGIPFFAAGIFMILTVSGVIPVSNASEMPPWGWLALAVMGLVFTGVGGTFVFGRAWTTLDVTRRLVIKQWGLLIPLRERTYPLTGYSAVTLGFVRGDSDTADTFPVGLKAEHGSSLPLCSFTTYADSRECAIAVARHLHLEIEDSTTDHRVRVTPADAERSFRERAIEFRPEAAVAQPANLRSTVTREPDGLRIDIPYPPTSPIGVVFGFVPLIIPIIVVPWMMNFFRHTNTPDAIGWVFVGFVTIFFGLLPGMTVVNALRRSRRGGTIVQCLAARDPDSGARCMANPLDRVDRCVRHPRPGLQHARLGGCIGASGRGRAGDGINRLGCSGGRATQRASDGVAREVREGERADREDTNRTDLVRRRTGRRRDPLPARPRPTRHSTGCRGRAHASPLQQLIKQDHTDGDRGPPRQARPGVLPPVPIQRQPEHRREQQHDVQHGLVPDPASAHRSGQAHGSTPIHRRCTGGRSR